MKQLLIRLEDKTIDNLKSHTKNHTTFVRQLLEEYFGEFEDSDLTKMFKVIESAVEITQFDLFKAVTGSTIKKLRLKNELVLSESIIEFTKLGDCKKYYRLNNEKR